MSYYIILYFITSYRIISYHITYYHILSFVMSCHVMFCLRAVGCVGVWCCVVLFIAVFVLFALRCVVVCCVVLDWIGLYYTNSFLYFTISSHMSYRSFCRWVNSQYHIEGGSLAWYWLWLSMMHFVACDYLWRPRYHRWSLRQWQSLGWWFTMKQYWFS